MKLAGERVCEEIAVLEVEFAFDDGVARVFLFGFFVFVDSKVYECSSLVSCWLFLQVRSEVMFVHAASIMSPQNTFSLSLILY